MRLRTLLDLGYLVSDQSMRLAVDGLSRFLVRSFGKAEDLAALLIKLVSMVGNPVLALDFLVLPVGLGHCFCGQPFHGPVVVHEKWHRTNLLSPPLPERDSAHTDRGLCYESHDEARWRRPPCR